VTLFCVVIALGATDLAADLPPGTDLVIRLQISELREGFGEAWDELRPFAGIRPESARAVQQAEREFRKFISKLERMTGADLGRDGVEATLMVDLDAGGGRVVSAIIRGALPAKIDEKEEELRLGTRSFKIDDRIAYRGDGMAWTFLEQPSGAAILLVGDERGLRRQLRVALGGGAARAAAATDPIVRVVGRLRESAPVWVAFALPAPANIEGLSDFGHLVRRVESGTVLADAGRIEAHLVSRTEKDQRAVAHGIRSGAAVVRGVVALLQGSAELLSGLDEAARRSDLIPRGIKAKALAPILESWADDFRFAAKVRDRPGHATEVQVELSSFRGVLAAAMLGLTEVWASVGGDSSDDVEVEVLTLLVGLRAAELLHKEIEGEYVECGPTPRVIPTQPVRWPADACFAKLAFEPTRPVRIQIEAIETNDRLLLIARGDPDGDGIPHVWYLGGDSVQVRGLSRRQGGRH